MKTAYTPGPLTHRAGSDPHNQGQIYADDDERGATIAITYNDEGGHNGARLVACWNAHADLVEALRFYADRDNWKERETGIGMMPGDAEMDGGAKARAAMEKAGVEL